MASSSGKLLGGVGDIVGGISSFLSSRKTASLLEEQGSLSRDDYYRQAALIQEEGSRTRSKQTMEYISNGVEIAGTPQLVLKETLSRAQAQARSYQVTGENVLKLSREKAKITKDEGMADLITSVLEASALLVI